MIAAEPDPADGASQPRSRRPAEEAKREAGSRRSPGRRRIARYRPGLVEFTLDELAGIYGPPVWERRLDPTSELILTILTQNTADTNAEIAFERSAPPTRPGSRRSSTSPARAGAATACRTARRRTGPRVEFAPIEELIDVIRPAGLATQKAPRIQASLRKIREERGDYSLEFLGEMTALEARDWLTGDPRHRQEDRVGRAAVLLRPAADPDRPPRRAGHEADRPPAAEGDRRPRPRRSPSR